MTLIGTQNCQAASGPLAYLADLLDYILTHVTKTQPGLQGEYYDDLNLSTLKLTRVDPKVEFVWGAGSPHPSIAATTFSMRWTGQVQPRFSETYTFYTVSSDGARLWVNDQWVVNNWTNHTQTENSGTITLAAGQKYTLKLEHYKNASSAAGIKLLWSSQSQAKEIIPPGQLFHENIDAKFLAETFYQPFGDLPTLCEAMDTPVSQVRLCSEVLRRYLQAKQLPSPGSTQANVLAEAEKAYGLAVYRALLIRLGATYEELRLALTGSPEAQAALATRLGIQATRLNTLFLDPETVTEPLLEKLFGLADTRRHPLSKIAKLDDPQNQFTRWRLDGVEWDKNTDPEGLLYVRLRKQPSFYQVSLYRHAAKSMAMLVASGSRNINAVGPILLTPANNSGLSGSVEINYVADSETIQFSVIPSFLAWRLERLRVIWFDQDHGSAQTQPGRPLIDPDLIGTEYLKPTSTPVMTLWQERRMWIDTKLNTLKSTRESKPSALDGLNEILKVALALSASEAMSAAILLQQANDAEQGLDISPWLDSHHLGRDAFLYLGRIGKLVTGNMAVMASEWADVYLILAQVQKRRQFAAWRNQEQNAKISLSPDFFQLPDSTATRASLPGWQATAATRREWKDILQMRLDQERAVVAALGEAVRATEAATLSGLRDALVLATDAPGDDLETKARWITDYLLIDAQTSGGPQATRISQAVETLQGLLYSLRTGQLSDTYPDLILAADNFDEEWPWIGSYATWRAAIGVFLYPENILLPSLRQRQTPAFRALVSDLRANRRLTPEQARAAAGRYSQYYREVCSLAVEATSQTETRITTSAVEERRTLFYLFARERASGRAFWSAYDPQDTTGYAQTFWEVVPGLNKVERIIGAIPHEISPSERFIHLLVEWRDKGRQKLGFIQYDLERQLWGAEVTELELPSASVFYTVVAVQAQTEKEPPELFLYGPGGIYRRPLDRQGSGWEATESEWGAFQVTVSSLLALVAVLKISGQSYWLCYFDTNGHLRVVKSNFTTPPSSEISLNLEQYFFVGAFPWTGADEIVVFYRPTHTDQTFFRRLKTGSIGTERTATAGLDYVTPSYSQVKGIQRQIAYHRAGGQEGSYRCTFNQPSKSADGLAEVGPTRVTPFVTGPFGITEHLSGVDLQTRRAQVQTAVETNKTTASNLTYIAEAYYFVPIHLALQLQAHGHYTSALDWFCTLYDYRTPAAQRKIYYGLTLEEALPNNYQRSQDWLLDPLSPHTVAAGRANSYTRFTLLSLIDCFLDFADAEFTRDTAESVPRARTLYLTALELLGLPEIQPAPTTLPPFITSFGLFHIPTNPIGNVLRLRAELSLFKLRHGRNIAGLERHLEPYVAPTEAGNGLLAIGAGGQLVLPGSGVVQPTPYRFSVLIERAKTLVQLAAQIEAAMLSALEKRDAELYNLLKARQDVQLTRAGVRLQELRLLEAEDGVKLAQLQQERTQIQFDYFDELLIEDISALELASLFFMGQAALVAATLGQAGNAISTMASMVSTLASYQRRRQEWEFQRTLAQQDLQIGTQQIRLADDHVRIVGQERLIAGLQAEHTEAVVDFLANKFTNAELFDWMSGILERVYAYFLQQATAVAKLAENQLAFERQESPPSFIQADYWEAPTEGSLSGSTDGRSPDRRGLTGSARLLQDIFQLDQYAFETNQRKLQLTKTISLAQMAPAEFQLFRETGVMVFNTPLELFDRDFPGHYLRLIRRVRTSVIALIPPTLGIRATLSNTGVSRVVAGGPVFQPVVVNHPPQSVALSSPREATGLFELDQQPEMLLPFESLGVDTTWEFRLPRAANLFDYSTIADVLLTIEYTALDNFDYRQQVIQGLSPNLSADRPFSFRHQFADQWYDLHNPDQAAQPMVVRFKTGRADFAPNLEDLRIQHVLLYFVSANGDTPAVPITTTLRFSPAGQALSATSPGGLATTMDGVISTRRGNASNWLNLINLSPSGEWELALENTAEIRNLFKNETITDVLLVITYQGQTPAWPA